MQIFWRDARVITLSDTRNEASDTSGARSSAAGAEHHLVSFYSIIRDGRRAWGVLGGADFQRDVDVILTNGGTGISRRDHTIPVIEKHLTTVLARFGECFGCCRISRSAAAP